MKVRNPERDFLFNIRIFSKKVIRDSINSQSGTGFPFSHLIHFLFLGKKENNFACSFLTTQCNLNNLLSFSISSFFLIRKVVIFVRYWLGLLRSRLKGIILYPFKILVTSSAHSPERISISIKGTYSISRLLLFFITAYIKEDSPSNNPHNQCRPILRTDILAINYSTNYHHLSRL